MSARNCLPANSISRANSWLRDCASSNVVANAGDREHASAGGDERAVGTLLGPGVKDEDVARQRRKVDAAPMRGAPGIPARRAPSSPRRARRQIGCRPTACPPRAMVNIASAIESSSDIAGSTACVSGSPNRQLNSTTFGPSAVSISADVEQAGERRAARSHCGERRANDALERSRR